MSVLYVSRERGEGGREGRKEESEEAKLRIVLGKEHQGPTERAKCVMSIVTVDRWLSFFFFFERIAGKEAVPTKTKNI